MFFKIFVRKNFIIALSCNMLKISHSTTTQSDGEIFGYSERCCRGGGKMEGKKIPGASSIDRLLRNCNIVGDPH